MVLDARIKSDQEAMEIEAYNLSESMQHYDTTGYFESLPLSFPEFTIPAINRRFDQAGGYGSRQDELGDDLASSYESWGITRFNEIAAIGSAQSTQDVFGERTALDEGIHDRYEELAREHFPQSDLTAEIRKAEERGRDQGMEIGLTQGREEASRDFKKEFNRVAVQASALLESFSQARASHLHDLEQEAVKLALAIAARILRREAQTDPLLLMGAVRVALGQLANSTLVRLRVPAQDQALWEESFALMPRLAIRPQVIGEAGMELGECHMETDLGSVDLGLWPQLKAIERGFFESADNSSGSNWHGEDTASPRPVSEAESREADSARSHSTSRTETNTTTPDRRNGD